MAQRVTPRTIPGAGAAGEPLPAEQPYDEGLSPYVILSLDIHSGKPDYSSPLLDIHDENSGSSKSVEVFNAPGVGPTGVGSVAVAADEGMGPHSVIPRLWKAGLDAWGSILGGGSHSQRGNAEDSEGSVLLEPPAWSLNRGTVKAVGTAAPGQQAESAYLPSVFVTG
ncbi:MAG: hypothetical protein KGJ45_11505 [Elusimicrobia bacterium]|nr:hypothetical protein [Elusimicrobiota bacterium]